MRRTAVLGSAGTLLAGALVAGVLTTPSASAEEKRDRGAAEARGVRIAAVRAAEQGIGWKDCPAAWSLPAPIQCGQVTVPVDYARPNGRTIKIAVDPRDVTCEPHATPKPAVEVKTATPAAAAEPAGR